MPGERPGQPTLLLGSHIDTVRDAGHYDGNLGVVAAIEAVAALHAAGERLPFAIEVIAFGDEEGVRFPSKLTGSRAVAGTFEPQSLDITDQHGVHLEAALRSFGCDPAAIPALARRREDVLGYVELHIEQGPVLEELKLPVGIVTAIAGASRFRIEVVGEAGHAGTVPMSLRKDALAAAAEMILAVERRAAGATEPALVATVGAVEASPGAPNVVPGKATFALDIRAPIDADRLKAIEELVAAFATLAARRHVRVKVEKFYDEPAVACDPGLVEALEAAVQRAGLAPHRLPSGAGHDGLAIAALCPIAMLFVRCKGGISHNPAEVDHDQGRRRGDADPARLPASLPWSCRCPTHGRCGCVTRWPFWPRVTPRAASSWRVAGSSSWFRRAVNRPHRMQPGSTPRRMSSCPG